MVSSTGVKDTVRNVRATGEFVLNIVTMEVLEDMVFTSTDFPADEDEFDWSGLTAVPSAKVAPPRIGQAKAHLECVSVDEMTLGDATLVFGRVVHIHIDPGVWRDGRVDPALLDPVCRLSAAATPRSGSDSGWRFPDGKTWPARDAGALVPVDLRSASRSAQSPAVIRATASVHVMSRRASSSATSAWQVSAI